MEAVNLIKHFEVVKANYLRVMKNNRVGHVQKCFKPS